MKYTNKRGVSTLISVVLLVGFVVVLGLVIGNWGTSLIKKNIEKSETRIGTDLDCLSVNVKLVAASTGDVVFVENNNLKDKKLVGFISRFDTGNRIFVDYKNKDTEIKAFGAETLVYSFAEDRNGNPEAEYNNLFSADSSVLKSIEVIPQIELDNGEVVDCVKKSTIFTF